MKVKLIDHFGSDLTVVNCARVSFNKESLDIGEIGRARVGKECSLFINT